MHRDEYGLIDLKEFKFDKNTFMIDDKKYYYKKIRNIQYLYNELIAEELAKKVGTPCVSYDIGVKDDQIVTFSEDFVKNSIYIPMGEVLNEEYNESFISNNLEDVKKALTKKYQNTVILNDLMNDLLKMCVFNFIIANHDNHSDNYGIWKHGNTLSISPSYDNMDMLDEGSIFDGFYALGIDSSDYYSNNDIFEKFIIKYPEYVDLIFKNLEYISDRSVNEILEIVENKIDARIDTNIKEKIKNKFMYNRAVIKQKIITTINE